MLYRSLGALFTSFSITLILLNTILNNIKNKKIFEQPIRKLGPVNHVIYKLGIPSMGGIFIIISIFFSTIIWGNIYHPYIKLLITSLILFSFIGILDDYKKLSSKNTIGLTMRTKLILIFLFDIIILYILINYNISSIKNVPILLPIIKYYTLDIKYFYNLFVIIMIIIITNGINILDGLDGLMIGILLIMILFFFIIICFLSHPIFSSYWGIEYDYCIKEIIIFCIIIFGCSLGFLWFNSLPARIFIGDTGSLSLGSCIVLISIFIQYEILFFILNFITTIEILSVIFQIFFYKVIYIKIFKIAPIHHHFEYLGFPENRIVMKSCIITVIFSLISLYTIII